MRKERVLEHVISKTTIRSLIAAVLIVRLTITVVSRKARILVICHNITMFCACEATAEGSFALIVLPHYFVSDLKALVSSPW